MTHGDDEGHVTMFTDDKQILFACDKGHYWIVTPDSSGTTGPEMAGGGGGGVPDEPRGHAISRLRAAFGPGALEVLGVQE